MAETLTISEENQINLSEKIEKYQKNFLNSQLGDVVNNAIDIGLKIV